MFRLIFLFLILSGCAAHRHEDRLASLDSQYKAGLIDPVQYHAKYLAEVSDYNSKKAYAASVL